MHSIKFVLLLYHKFRYIINLHKKKLSILSFVEVAVPMSPHFELKEIDNFLLILPPSHFIRPLLIK
jgi:hypothetical protein